MRDYKLEFGLEDFSLFGLNSERNFLTAPDGDGFIYLEDDEDIAEYSIEVLSDYYCECSALFTITYDNRMFIAILDEGEIMVAKSDFNLDLFKEVDGAYRLCCYAIIEEVQPGKFRVLED